MDPRLVRFAQACRSDAALVEWARSIEQEDLEAVWRTCPDARALLKLAAPFVPRKDLVRAASACAHAAIGELGQGEMTRLAKRVLQKVDAWTHDEATLEEVRAVGFAVLDALDGGDSDVTSAAIATASTIEDPGSAMDAADAAALSLTQEGEVINPAFAHLRRDRAKTKSEALATLANVVRGVVPCPRVGP